jgi:protein TonB
MKNNPDNIPDFDELLFENRNKEYGAYQLRKRYPRVLFTGILISTLIGCSAVILPFIIHPNDERVMSGGSRFVQVRMDNLKPPEEEIYVPPAPPLPESGRAQETAKYIAPEVVDTTITIENTTAATDEILAQSGNNPADTQGYGPGDELLSGEGTGYVEEPFFMVEVMPSFRGGDINKFREWIYKRTNYPQAAIDAKIKGTVFLTFIVEKDGSVSNVIVLKGVDPLLDEEAVKAISESPKWSPGLQRGQPVRVRFQIPLSFIL